MKKNCFSIFEFINTARYIVPLKIYGFICEKKARLIMKCQQFLTTKVFFHLSCMFVFTFVAGSLRQSHIHLPRLMDASIVQGLTAVQESRSTVLDAYVFWPGSGPCHFSSQSDIAMQLSITRVGNTDDSRIWTQGSTQLFPHLEFTELNQR